MNSIPLVIVVNPNLVEGYVQKKRTRNTVENLSA